MTEEQTIDVVSPTHLYGWRTRALPVPNTNYKFMKKFHFNHNKQANKGDRKTDVVFMELEYQLQINEIYYQLIKGFLVEISSINIQCGCPFVQNAISFVIFSYSSDEYYVSNIQYIIDGVP